MIPHHQEAVDAAKIITASTNNSALKSLAQRMVRAQAEEILLMEGWKKQWYAQSKYAPTYLKMMPPLQEFTDAQKDQAFLQSMIAHHQVAIRMAQQVLALHPRSEVAAFAQQIIAVQNGEISMIQSLLKNEYS